MKLLNLCCGAVRPQTEEWTNLDHLAPALPPESVEWQSLIKEKNYIEWDVLSAVGTDHVIPLPSESLDGILASHCVEHWDCHEAVRVMHGCLRVLKPGGILLVSVPDASYFRRVYDRDTVENAVELFGEPIHLPDGEETFFGYGLWNRFHQAILTEDSLWAYFVRAGFYDIMGPQFTLGDFKPAMNQMARLLNRIPFSLVMAGVKE